MNTAEVKSVLTMTEVSRFYGFTPNRAGFIQCPFHADKTGSLKIYPDDRGWHCFGCGVGKDIYDFVMRLFDTDFRGALSRLSFDFNLGLTDDKPDPTALARIRREKRERAAREEAHRKHLNALCATHRRLWDVCTNSQPTLEPDGTISFPPSWVKAVKNIDYLSYLISEG